jgi:hypothetical protein
LFTSICIFELLELTFDGKVTRATLSNNAGRSASDCLRANRGLRLTEGDEPIEFTFGDLVLDVWECMKEAQKVCYSTTNNRKHVEKGMVFGYDLYDVFGTGHVPLRYLDEGRAGANFRSWEPLARLEALQVIFCNRVGSVIECAAQCCPGTPCGNFCQKFNGTAGVLSCLLQDFGKFFGQDWNNYRESGTLLLKNGFEWIPRGPDPFLHPGKHIPGGGACECCANLDRLQSLIPVGHRSIFGRLRRKLSIWLVADNHFSNTNWLGQDYAVRFGLAGPPNPH